MVEGAGSLAVISVRHAGIVRCIPTSQPLLVTMNEPAELWLLLKGGMTMGLPAVHRLLCNGSPHGVKLSFDSDKAEIKEIHSTRRHGEHVEQLDTVLVQTCISAVAAVSVVPPC
jgi:hypothetical protein